MKDPTQGQRIALNCDRQAGRLACDVSRFTLPKKATSETFSRTPSRFNRFPARTRPRNRVESNFKTQILKRIKRISPRVERQRTLKPHPSKKQTCSSSTRQSWTPSSPATCRRWPSLSVVKTHSSVLTTKLLSTPTWKIQFLKTYRTKRSCPTTSRHHFSRPSPTLALRRRCPAK